MEFANVAPSPSNTNAAPDGALLPVALTLVTLVLAPVVTRAPPRTLAVLSVKFTLSITASSPDKLIPAPTSALFPETLQPLITGLSPSETNAPPLTALLLVKLELVIFKPEPEYIAPEASAVLLFKLQSSNMSVPST